MDRDTAIRKLVANGYRPASTIPWVKFCDAVRDGCKAWFGDQYKRGYSDRHIKRRYSEMKI
jgi:hypothetical protein